MVYRTAPAATGPAPPRKWPHRAALTIATFVALSAGFIEIVDFGAHVDGPGVGYGTLVTLGAFVLGFTAFVSSLLMGVLWRWARWIGWGSGAALFVVFVVTRMPIRILHFTWERGCAHGSGEACWGWSSQFEGEERRVLRRKACTSHYDLACDVLLDGDDGDRKAACDSLGLVCSTCIHQMCDVSPTLCMKVNTTCRAASLIRTQ